MKSYISSISKELSKRTGLMLMDSAAITDIVLTEYIKRKNDDKQRRKSVRIKKQKNEQSVGQIQDF